ncbi:type II secretion system protein [Vagococcus sp. BWB3-3]|uniref:Type II secretion system protein n=1 Tax=Vagococcus allomyrinae TaxID=2794353 RepID=A0A940P7G8_9ENTE|nr:type II secretion system protein [Vagococcus allomyrinae]MBP1042802.1 type II secretion system protein [Vagococcus allomyrinae]
MKILKDERGLSLIELLGALAIFGLVAILLSSVLFSISKASTVQGQQVEFQQTANLMVSQIESISKTPGIYQDAQYYGKFTAPDKWKDIHIVKTGADASNPSADDKYASGANKIYVTDINDNDNTKADTYQIKEAGIKIKVLQQKNENDERKTHYGTGNYRDSFSIQTSGIVLFYKEEIEFSKYYDKSTGTWQLEKLLAENSNKVKYSRKFVYSYRDDQKAKGDVPGNGRW